MKGWQKTLLAFLVLGGLLTWIGLNELAPVGEKKDRIWKAKAEDVVKFEVHELAKGTAIACEKKDGAWRITAPVDLEADAETCDLAAKHLAEPEVERALERPEDLSPFGLKEPTVRAAFTTKKGVTHALLLGVKTPTDSGYFAMEEGGKAPYVIAAWSADNFRKSVGDLRQKTLLRLEPSEVKRVVIRRKTGGTIELLRQEAERWTLVKPVSGAADRFTVDGLLGDLKALKAQEVLEDRVAYSRYKLDQPTAEVVVYTGTGAGQTLTLSKPDARKDEAYASSTRLPFTWRLASAAVLTTATKPLDDFRDRLLLQLDREALTGAEVTVGGRRHVLVPGAKGAWKVTEPAGAAPAETELNDMLFELVYVRAESFVDDTPRAGAAYGLAAPRAEVLLRAKVDRKPVTYRYRLGSRRGDAVCLAFGDRPGVVGVRKDLLDKIERFADMVRAGPPKAPPAAKK